MAWKEELYWPQIQIRADRRCHALTCNLQAAICNLLLDVVMFVSGKGRDVYH